MGAGSSTRDLCASGAVSAWVQPVTAFPAAHLREGAESVLIQLISRSSLLKTEKESP